MKIYSKDFFPAVWGLWMVQSSWFRQVTIADKHLCVLTQLIGHGKLEFGTKSSCINSWRGSLQATILRSRGNKAMHSLPYCFFILVLHPIRVLGWSVYPLPFLLRMPFQPDLDLSGSASAGCRKVSVCSGRSCVGGEAESQVHFHTWLFFQKRDYHFFFPFKKTLVKGILVKNERQKLCSCACDQVWLQRGKINVLSVSTRATLRATGKGKAFTREGIT